MVHYHILAAAAFVAIVNALPLNINLGAYSPALVVGDGEISFSGSGQVEGLMTVLEGAAVSTAQGVAQQQRQQQPPAQIQAVPNQEGQVLRDQEAQQIANFQGISSKEIAPRVGEVATPNMKRDLAGFDRALRYAEVALTQGPKVQLGTGEGGSGIGIIVDNNQIAAARPGTGVVEGGHEAETAPPAGQTPPEIKARDVEQFPRRRAKVTTMYVRRGVPPALSTTSNQAIARQVAAPEPASAVPVSKRDAIDSVNLNVEGSEGITMTFIEEEEEAVLAAPGATDLEVIEEEDDIAEEH